ncbi:NUDIX hydrolase [Gemmatimonas sp.]|uniref:nucleotide triphosphate diphosphatase NUDT15 n=1 Tax=Gemmatimonas sp. TaxID=1962908 RepID=UPI0022C6B73D|nr:NUDIX hydrolase [Gemmatimonas sp.]MCZ8206488.1 NUDIX hydrolase [Gemmatimonas sp.]
MSEGATGHGGSGDGSRWPRLGVGVIVQRGERVLLGKRRSTSHGDGVWQFPGGHLEWGESVADCARREVREETGLEVRVVGQGPYTNDYFAGSEPGADKHYVTLFVLAESDAGEPQRLEPHKCDAWEWFTWDTLPTPLFLPIVHLLEGGFMPPPPREGAM